MAPGEGAREQQQQHVCWSCCSLRRHRRPSPVHPSSSLPGWPAETRHRARSQIPTLLARLTHPRGDPGRPGRGGRRPGRRRRKGWPRRRARARTGRLRPLGPQEAAARPPDRPPAPQARPPRRRKRRRRRRLGSAQFKLSPRPPPLPPAAAPQALRLPAALPRRSPLGSPRAFPSSAGGPRGSARPEPGSGRAGRPGAEAHPWCCS